MITITSQDDRTPLKINKQLLYEYKEECDTYLVNIKRELTRALVDYKLFQQLQQVNNSFFIIIDYLDTERYTVFKELKDHKVDLNNDINIFTKNCRGKIPNSIFRNIYYNLDKLMLTINKLIEIVYEVNERN